MRITKLTKDQFINGRQRVKGEVLSGNFDGEVLIKDINKKNKQKTERLIQKEKDGKIKQDKLSAKI